MRGRKLFGFKPGAISLTLAGLLFAVCFFGQGKILAEDDVGQKVAKYMVDLEWYRHWDGEFFPKPVGQLSKLGVDAIPAIVEGIKTKDHFISSNLGISLAMIGEPAIAPLKQLSETGDANSRAVAVQSLHEMEMLDDKKDDMNRQAKLWKKIRPVLLNAIRDKDPDVRQWAFWGFKYHAEHENTKLLVDAMLHDEAPNVRLEAAVCLEGSRESTVEFDLARALQDTEPKVRAMAAFALGAYAKNLGTRRKGAFPRIVVRLAALQDDSSSEVGREATEALDEIVGEHVINCLALFLEDREGDPNNDGGEKVVQLMGRIANRDFGAGRDGLEAAKKWWKAEGKKQFGEIPLRKRDDG